MIKSALHALSLCCFALIALVAPAHAQDSGASSLDDASTYQVWRADKTWYLKGRIGLNFYGGDRDVNPFNEVQNYIENIGVVDLGLEVGYAVTDRLSLSLMHLSGPYPRIEDEPFAPVPAYPGYLDLDPDNTSKWRHHFSFLARSHVLPQKRVSPYGQLGFNVSFGKINDSIETGIGPTTGIGLDAAVTDRLGIFIELNGIFSFDDGALDLADTEQQARPGQDRGIDASDFDAFTFFGFGVRLNMRSPFVPVLVDCSGPLQLVPNETGTFSATINEDATRPVNVAWDFRDGGTASGLLATRSFAEPGTYAVTVTATNARSSDAATCPVEVLAPPMCQITAVPATLSMCRQPLDPVQFQSTVTGAPPITYRWDFGDGASSTSAEPSHRYTRTDAEPDILTVTASLNVSNAAGATTCSVPVAIEPCPCRDLAELGQVCYERNESLLPGGPSRQNLQNNVEALRANPSILVLVEGYASPNERNAQSLADDRARAVAQFYIDNGIDPSRIMTRSVVQEVASKTGPVCTLTIPLPCDEAERARFLEERMPQN